MNACSTLVIIDIAMSKILSTCYETGNVPFRKMLIKLSLLVPAAESTGQQTNIWKLVKAPSGVYLAKT